MAGANINFFVLQEEGILAVLSVGHLTLREEEVVASHGNYP